ncbi:hypothetical protein DUNSADRAFT_4259 [Dunaliella salina]|uniref:Uncharacterized protein n=1 Tax=Dunaliella salina TaxID=3046 RepID=A0ABQ7GSF0_DUNSA|nr:hypothetical protein DUNSADRAFT_4259 [Dunaliella salina]|eukprot:KAF5837513.1 hypothetical protein DUNSADRAFT_4259 [Dunaliella salina]
MCGIHLYCIFPAQKLLHRAHRAHTGLANPSHDKPPGNLQSCCRHMSLNRGALVVQFGQLFHKMLCCRRRMSSTLGALVIQCGRDKSLARVIDLERMAIRPFSCHKAKIRAVAVASPNVFLTGCEDGVVRQLDVREQPLVIDSSALRDAYCAESIVVEQRSEKTKDRVGVNSIAVDPLKPMFATGGGDPLVRVYDARMMSRGRPMPWVLAYVPNPVAAACSSRSGQPRHRTITSIAYDHTGHRLLASYSKDSIYSFSVKDDCFFPSTLPRELGGPSPRVPSSTRGPGDPARPGSRATFGNTEAFRGAGGRAPVGAPRGSAAAAPRPPPRESGHSEDDDQWRNGMLGTGLVTDNLGQHEPLGQPTASPATGAAPASSDPNTGTTTPRTFQTPHTRNNTASGAAGPEGPTSGSAGHEAHGEQGGRARQSNDAQGVLAAGVRHREEGLGAHTAGAPHSWQPVQGVGLLQRAFTPFGQALYRRLFPSWQWRQGQHAQQHQHQQHPQQHQQQHQHPHQQSPQEGPVPGVRSSLGQLATARTLPSRCSEEDTEMEDISGGPVSTDLITHQQQQQQQQQEQGRRGTRRARPSSSPSPDNPSDVQPHHGKRSRLSSGAPRHPSSAPAAPLARAKSKTGRTSTHRPTQPPSAPTQPASAEGVTHAHASPQLHPHHRQQHPSPPLRLLLHPQQQCHQQQRCVSSQDHALQNRHAAGAAQPSSYNPAGTAVTTQLARPSGHNPAAPRWHNPRASGQHVSMAVRVRTAVGAEEPLLLQSTSSSWPNVHPHGPNSSRVGLHRVGTSSQWRADTPAEGQSLPVVPPAARQAQQGGGARSAPSEADPPLERRRTAAPEQAQATHAQEPGEGYGRDQRQSSQAHPSWPWHFRDTLPRQQQRQQASAGVGGLPSERDDEGQAPTRGGATGAPVLEEGQRLEGGQLASGSGDGGGGTRTPGDATREGGALNARNMAAAATAAAQPLNTLNALGLLGEGGTLARGESQGMLDEDVLDALGRLEALGVLEAPQSRQPGARAGHAARSAGAAGAGASVGTAAAGPRDGGGGLSMRPSRARAPLAQSTTPGQSSFTTAAAVAATAAPGPSSRAAASHARGSASAPHTEEGTDAALARTGMQQQQQKGASSDGALARVPSLSSSQLGQLHGRDGAVIAPANTTCSAGEGTAEGSAQGEMGGTGAPAAVAAAAAAGAAHVPLRRHSAHAVGCTDSVSSPPQRAGAGAGAGAGVSVRGGPSEHPSITAALADATGPGSARQASVRMRRRHPPPEGVTEEDSLLPIPGMHEHAVHAREPEADQGGDVPMHEACSSAVPITGMPLQGSHFSFTRLFT